MKKLRNKICVINGCAEPHLALGYCRMHYMRTKRHGSPFYEGVPVKERLLNKSYPNKNGCWIWHGKANDGGYGIIKIDGIEHRAHRISFEIFIGEIPDGILVCHTCDVRNCINPEHLFLGTHQDNSDDMISKGRGYWPGPKVHWKKKLKIIK